MIKKQAAMLAVCAVLLLCVVAAGCSGPAASPTPSNAKNSSTSNSATQAAASEAVTPTATPTGTPTATPTSSAESTPTSSPSAGGSAGMSVLFFYLPGCPHCAALENSTSFAQLQNTVPVTWTYYETPNAYGVSAAPTLILLKNGVEVNRWVAVEDATGILAQINAG